MTTNWNPSPHEFFRSKPRTERVVRRETLFPAVSTISPKRGTESGELPGRGARIDNAP